MDIKKRMTVICKRVMAFLPAIFLLLQFFVFPQQAVAFEGSRVVRVGFFNLPGFQEYDVLGNPSGYNAEYLNEISRHNGWKFEYIKADSWGDALEMLEKREIDLLAPGQKTPEREEKFAFSDYSFGTEYGSLLTLSNNNTVCYEDFEQFSKIKIGCVETWIYREAFIRYATINNFDPQITFYKNTTEMLAALHAGEVDAIAANLMNAKSDMKVLAKFSPEPFYYMTNKEQVAFLKELNEVLLHNKITHSDLENNLTVQHFPFYRKVAFTKEEIDFINSSPVLNIGCVSNRAPLSHWDEKTELATGITPEVLNKISQISGLKFKLIPLPSGQINYNTLREYDIDLISNMEHTSVNSTIAGFELSDPYLRMKKVFVGKQSVLDTDKPLTIALSTGSQTIEKIIQTYYPNATVVIYDSIGEALDSVISGKSTALIENQYAIDTYLHMSKYETLTIMHNEGLPDELSVATVQYQEKEGVADPLLSDPRLIKIINKSIASISDEELSTIIIQHTTNKPYYFTLSDFYYRYRYFIVLLVLALLIAIRMGLVAHKQRVDNEKILKNSETNLRNITNNINGGVVVLLPDEGLKITFANEGFLSLIQYSGDEFESLKTSDYVTYVHPDDVVVLNNTIASFHGSRGAQISMQLRLLRKDQTFVPILFNGTLALEESGEHKLYCVIMDISEQLRIMNELEHERARYQILINKSNDIIFSVDFDTKIIAISNQFEEIFGWTLPTLLEENSADYVASLWRVHEDDREALRFAIKQVIEQEEDSECKVRVCKKDGTNRWCIVSHNIIYKDKGMFAIIGKVTDIHDEVMEKEHLMRQTQMDGLTGLYNKEAFYSLAQQYFQNQPSQQSALIFMDLDNFKQINDLLGHVEGDRAIVDTARKLESIFDSEDYIARFGGDEFCILHKNYSLSLLEDKLQKMLSSMKTNYKSEKCSVPISCSIGVALRPQHASRLEQLVLFADQALYNVKEQGKGMYAIYSNEDCDMGQQPIIEIQEEQEVCDFKHEQTI